MMIVGQVSTPRKQKRLNLSRNPSWSRTAPEPSPYDSGGNEQMIGKKKNKRSVPTEIPIIWVNIVDADWDGSVIL